LLRLLFATELAVTGRPLPSHWSAPHFLVHLKWESLQRIQ
jgi:hypothetical protein